MNLKKVPSAEMEKELGRRQAERRLAQLVTDIRARLADIQEDLRKALKAKPEDVGGYHGRTVISGLINQYEDAERRRRERIVQAKSEAAKKAAEKVAEDAARNAGLAGDDWRDAEIYAAGRKR